MRPSEVAATLGSRRTCTWPQDRNAGSEPSQALGAPTRHETQSVRIGRRMAKESALGGGSSPGRRRRGSIPWSSDAIWSWRGARLSFFAPRVEQAGKEPRRLSSESRPARSTTRDATPTARRTWQFRGGSRGRDQHRPSSSKKTRCSCLSRDGRCLSWEVRGAVAGHSAGTTMAPPERWRSPAVALIFAGSAGARLCQRSVSLCSRRGPPHCMEFCPRSVIHSVPGARRLRDPSDDPEVPPSLVE